MSEAQLFVATTFTEIYERVLVNLCSDRLPSSWWRASRRPAAIA